MGLVKPLDVGDRGKPLTTPDVEGDLDNRSDVRLRWGVPLVYISRIVLIGD